LNRKPKKLLEDSLERVLEVVKNDLFGDEEEESVEGDFEGLEEPPVTVCRITRLRILTTMVY
jgi:ribosome biogenesis ATPase